MYYSNNELNINNKMTSLDGSQIFNGTYWDEFGLAHAFLQENSRVLVLGLAQGACIRPLLSTGKIKELTCIEIDDDAAKNCSAVYSKHFPDLEFDITRNDASDFLKQTEKKFDLIWVDLYLDNGYTDLYFNSEFWKDIKKTIAKNGIILINSFGLPMHLDPFRGNNGQSKFLKLMSQLFPKLKYIPYRRNMTLIIEEGSTNLNTEVPSIKLFDQMIIKSHILKYKNSMTLPEISSKQNCDANTFAIIDIEMRQKWMEIVSLINNYSDKYNLNISRINTPIEIRDLVHNDKLCMELLDKLLETRNEKIIWLPVFIGGEINCSKLNASWFMTWFIQNRNLLKNMMSSEYYSYFLPQVTAMVVNPNKNYRKYIFQLNEILNNELEIIK